MTTFFANANPKYKPPDDDGTIETEHFLNASKEIVPIFDILGAAFKPVKSDIDGNITRLYKRYETDPAKFKFLRGILEDEVERKCADDKNSATQALLWFKRALQYIMLFLQLVVEDHKSGTKTESIGGFARMAYDETLKNYHGWLVQKIFSVISRAVPYRKDFLKALALDQDDMEDKVVDDMEGYIQEVRANMDAVHKMLTEMDLDFQYKV